MNTELEAHDTEGSERLFGTPGAEHLHFDLASCYETDIEPWVDEHDRRPRQIEEWSVHERTYHLPAADRIVEWIVEWAGENGEIDEDAFYGFENASKSDDVLAAAETLRSVLASKVTYRMANKLLRTYTVEWNADDEPLIDGTPLYVRGDA